MAATIESYSIMGLRSRCWCCVWRSQSRRALLWMQLKYGIVLEMTHVVATPKGILERFADAMVLKPALSGEQIARFQSEQPGPLPSEILELLTYSGGIEIDLSRLLG